MSYASSEDFKAYVNRLRGLDVNEENGIAKIAYAREQVRGDVELHERRTAREVYYINTLRPMSTQRRRTLTAARLRDESFATAPPDVFGTQAIARDGAAMITTGDETDFSHRVNLGEFLATDADLRRLNRQMANPDVVQGRPLGTDDRVDPRNTALDAGQPAPGPYEYFDTNAQCVQPQTERDYRNFIDNTSLGQIMEHNSNSLYPRRRPRSEHNPLRPLTNGLVPRVHRTVF
jgi:hypothetical protein